MGAQAEASMTPQMRERYGLDRNPWPSRIAAGLTIAVFTVVLGYFAVQLTTEPIDARLLVFQQVQPDRVDITFEVNRPAALAVACVLRAQDGDRVDVGYAEATLPAGSDYVQPTYSMRVIGPVGVVEILGCGPSGEPLRVPPPAFPPGVLAPDQPWTAG